MFFFYVMHFFFIPQPEATDNIKYKNYNTSVN